MAVTLTVLALACALLVSPGATAALQTTQVELEARVAAGSSDLWDYIRLAGLRRDSGRFDEAEQVLRAALAVQPGAAMVFSQLAALFAAGGKADPDKMLQVAEEWMRADPASPRAVTAAANAHHLFASQRTSNPADALNHADQGLLLLQQAPPSMMSDRSLLAAKANLLGLKARLVSDPAERDALRKEAQALGDRLRAVTPTGIPGGVIGEVVGGSPAPPHPLGAVRVGGRVLQPRKVTDALPAYPREALAARVQGVVILDVVIGTDGKVAHARVLRSIPLLDQAAIETVRRWEFTVTQIDGQPFPVIMTVTVGFTLP